MSQCTTAAQCLKELARVMDQFEVSDITKAIHSRYVKCSANSLAINMSLFHNPSDWSFAIAEVEGKPVFVGDKLWCHVNSNYFEACVHNHNRSFDHCSWNPPKPKTITVELLAEDVEFYASDKAWGCTTYTRIACRKALGIKD